MADILRDGVRIHFETTGPTGNARVGNVPLLLSHGFGAAAAMWEPNVPALAAQRQVITWDMRGHGRSESPDDPALYSQDASVADMAAVLDAAGAPRAVIGGLSLGGYLSLAFWMAHPQRVAALILCDTGPGFRNDEARDRWNERALATADRLERKGLAGLNDPTSQAWHESASGLAHAARGMLTQRDGSVMAALPSVDVPVLVLVGADDRAFLGAADYVTAKIPGAVKAVIPGAGHTANMDQPDIFDREVLAFLDGLELT